MSIDTQCTLLFAGDFCPIGLYEQAARTGQLEHYAAQVRAIPRDLFVVNLECPITAATAKITKVGPHLKANPVIADSFKALGIDLFCLANNHILDYGEKGLLETLAQCDRVGIPCVGAGRNAEEAGRPLIKEINGIRIGFINCCESEWSIATRETPGANPIYWRGIHATMGMLRPRVDHIIAIIHGGTEYFPYPNPFLRDSCRFLVELGAKAVICHHTHVISGHEVYNGAPIFYGLGNFMFDKPHDHYGLLVKLHLTRSSVAAADCIGFRQAHHGKLIEFGDRIHDAVERQVNRVNEALLDPCRMERIWKAYVNSTRDAFLAQLLPNRLLSRTARVLLRTRLGAITQTMNRLFGTVNCESHRGRLLESIRQYGNGSERRDAAC